MLSTVKTTSKTMLNVLLALLTLSLVGCGENEPIEQKREEQADFTVNRSDVLTDRFVGFGTQYNNNLFTTLTSQCDGVTKDNLPELESKVRSLGSQYVRIFFDCKSWEDHAKYNPEYMSSFIRTVELANATADVINITYWHSSVVDDMAAFGNVLFDLIVNRGLTNVKQVTIQNEVNDTKMTQSDYKLLYSALDFRLKELGIRDGIELVSGDLTQTNQASWFNFMATEMSYMVEGYSSHIYWDFGDKTKPINRLDNIAADINKMSPQQVKPFYITEYGIRGERISGDPYYDPGYLPGTTTPISWTNEYALLHAKFNIDALNKGCAGLAKWDCYKAKYDNGTQYHSLIGPASSGYPLYPAYYMTYLFTHAGRSGWKVVQTDRSSKAAGTKSLAAMFSQNGSELALFAVSTSASGQLTFSVDGLPAERSLNAYCWNSDGEGKITKMESVVTDKNGKATFNVKVNAMVVVTTTDIALP